MIRQDYFIRMVQELTHALARVQFLRRREEYEQALKDRARSFFEKARDWYAQALDRAESRAGAADVAAAIRSRLDTARTLLAGLAAQGRAQ